MPTLQDEISGHPTRRVSRALTLGVLLGVALGLVGCPQDQPKTADARPRAETNQWLIVDVHTHTKFSDGRATVDEVVQKAIEAGCDAMAITDHSHYKGTASEAYLAEIEAANSRYPGLLVLGGMEWNIPPYGGREHVTVLLEPSLTQRALAEFKERFDRKETAAAALTWLRAQMEDEEDAVLIYNHPSRRDEHPDENLTDMQAWRAVNTLFVGFEGAPGHQKRMTNIGGYKRRFKTEDRWDPVAAEIGGTWDTLLDSGENIWAALATSDYHSDRGDYVPCAFSRTYVLAAERSAQAIISALRAGAFWADHGLILDALTLEASSSRLDRPAMPGEVLAVRPDDVVTLRLEIERGPGAADTPLHIELIENCTTGTPRLSLEGALLSEENRFEKQFSNLKRGADQRTCYVRARIRKALDAAPDLMAYTNPIRFRID